MENPDKLKCHLAALGEVYGKEVTTTMAQLYWGALLDYTDEQVDSAIQAGVKKWKCYGRIPTPGEIIEEISGGPDAEVLAAWETLSHAITSIGRNQSIVFDDGRIPRIIEAMGGWQEVCSWPMAEMQFRRHEFFKLFRAAGPRRGHGKVVGLVEAGNFARGFLEHIPPPFLVGQWTAQSQGLLSHSDLAATDDSGTNGQPKPHPQASEVPKNQF